MLLARNPHRYARYLALLFAVNLAGVLSPVNAGTIEGRVTRSSDQLAIAGAMVSVKTNSDNPEVLYSTSTGPLGFFEIGDVDPGTYKLSVTHAAFGPFLDTVSVQQDEQIRTRIELTRVGPGKFIDVTVQVLGVSTGVPLNAVPIRMERFGDPADVTPADTRSKLTGASGTVTFRGVHAGHFRFDANSGANSRPHWESFSSEETSEDMQALAKSHLATFHLKPIPQNMVVQVNGFDPTANETGALEGIWVELEGLNPQDTNAVVVPSRTGTTDDDGQVKFKNLPPIPWRVTAKRLGYKPKQTVIRPGANGDLPSLRNINLNLLNTDLEVEIESPYKSVSMGPDTDRRFHDGLPVLLRGLKNSNTAGIERFVTARFEESVGAPVVDFENLLPGRYYIKVMPEPMPSPVVIAAEPDGIGFDENSVDLYEKTRFRARFKGRRKVETVPDQTMKTELPIRPIPAKIKGTLFSAEGRGESQLSQRDLAGSPVFNPHAQVRLFFEELQTFEGVLPFKALPSGGQTVVPEDLPPNIRTHEDGTFTIEVMPGFYGIKIPDLTNYWGSHARIRPEGQNHFQRIGWPYANPIVQNGKPVTSESISDLERLLGQRWGLAIPFSSDRQHELELFALRQAVDVIAEPVDAEAFGEVTSWVGNRIMVGPSKVTDSVSIPFGFRGGRAVLKSAADGSIIKETTEFEERSSTRFPRHAVYRVPNVGPGSYQLEFNHSEFQKKSLPVQIPDWAAPGLKPLQTPTTDMLLPLDENRIDVTPPPESKISLSEEISIYRWELTNFGDDYVKLGDFSRSLRVFYELSSSPGLFAAQDLFIGGGLSVPEAGDRILIRVETNSPTPGEPDDIRFFNGWHTLLQSDGTLQDTVYLGGPKSTYIPFDDGAAPMMPTEYPLQITTPTSVADATMSVDKVNVTLNDGGDEIVREAPNRLSSFEGPPTPVKVENAEGWVFADSDANVIINDDGSLKEMRLKIFMKRGLGVEGTVTTDDGTALTNAPVRVFNRFGALDRSRQQTTDDTGSFQVSPSFEAASTFFLDVTVPGFKPWRKRIHEKGSPPQDSDEPPVISEDVKLEPLNLPNVGSVKFDRGGLFLVGVNQAGTENEYKSFESVKDRLTTQWSVSVQPKEHTFDPFAAFDRADGSPEAGKLTTLDRIESVWLVDARHFPEGFFNGEPKLLSIPSDGNIFEKNRWLDQLRDNGLGNVFRRRAELVSQSDGSVIAKGEIPLWELPHGLFQPVIVVVTEHGAIQFSTEAEFPGATEDDKRGRELHGIRPPKWVASALDGMGVTAELVNAVAREEARTFLGNAMPSGRFEPLEVFEAAINEDDGFLSYDYNQGVKLNQGMNTPNSAYVGFGVGMFGMTANGTVSFGLDGRKQQTVMSSTAKLENIPLFSTRFDEDDSKNRKLIPPIVQKAFSNGVTADALGFDIEAILDIDLNGSGKRQLVDPPFEDKVSDIKTKYRVKGNLTTEIKVDLLRFLASFFPPSRPIVEGIRKLEATGVTVDGVIEGSVGAGIERSWRTRFEFPPKPKGTVPESRLKRGDPDPRVLRRHFLGGLTQQALWEENQNGEFVDTETLPLDFHLTWGFGSGLDIEVERAGGYVKAGGSGRFTTFKPDGATNDFPTRSLVITPNELGDWPPLERIKGNIGAHFELFLDVWVARVGKNWDFKGIPVNIDFGTESAFDLMPIEIESVRREAPAAPPASFEDKDNVLIDDFSDLGSFAVGSMEEGGALAFTDTDPEGGEMVLKWTRSPKGMTWSTPEPIASAPGILEVSLARLPGGGWMAVWGQFEEEEIGMMFPTTALRSAQWDPAKQEWSAPQTVETLNGVATDLKLIQKGSAMGLAYLHTTEGPLAERYSMDLATWAQGEWEEPIRALTDASIHEFDVLATSQNDGTANAVIAYTDRENGLQVIDWRNDSLSEPTELKPETGTELKLEQAGSDEVLLAWESAQGQLELFKRQTSGDWQKLKTAISTGEVSDLILQTDPNATEPTWLLAWSEKGKDASLHTAFVGTSGEMLAAPELLSDQPSGDFRALSIIPEVDGGLRMLTRLAGETSQIRQFFPDRSLSLPSAPVRLEIELIDGKRVKFTVFGPPGKAVELEKSTNLKTWSSVADWSLPQKGPLTRSRVPEAETVFYRLRHVATTDQEQ